MIPLTKNAGFPDRYASLYRLLFCFFHSGKYICSQKRLIGQLKSINYTIDHFGEPISHRILFKTVLLSSIELFYYNYLNGKHLPFIRKSCRNSEILKTLPDRQNILLFMHQPFMRYLPVWLCGHGFTVNSLIPKKTTFIPGFSVGLQSAGKYHRLHYRPIITLQKIRDKLLQGECLFVAAEGRIGKSHLQVRFGCGTITTPKGIYVLGQATKSPITPVFLRITDLFPFPRFEIRLGETFVMDSAPEDEIHKINSMFSWYYDQFRASPHLWKKIASYRYAVRTGRQ